VTEGSTPPPAPDWAPTAVESSLMRLIRWFRSAWADAGKSGEWMADAPAPQPLSRWGRRAIRTQLRTAVPRGFTYPADLHVEKLGGFRRVE
jgi:hypothetical protein